MEERDIVKSFITSKDLEELNKNIELCMNNGITLEDCIIYILDYYFYNKEIFEQFVLENILNGSEDRRKIILENLEQTGINDEILQDDRIKEYIKDNFEKVFELLGYESRECFIEGILEEQEGIEFIKDKIIQSNLMTNIYIRTRNYILHVLSKNEEGLAFILNNAKSCFSGEMEYRDIAKMAKLGISKEEIIENREYILERLSGKDVLQFINWLNKNGIDISKEVPLDKFIERLYSNIKDKRTLETIEIFYKELLKRQPNMKYTDIEHLGMGKFSSVYGVGDFVVKIGDGRQTPYLKYNRRILQPLLRQEITGKFPYIEEKEKQDYECYGTFVEIQNKVDTNWYDGLSQEKIFDELYKIYKEFREQGVIWTDISERNVGRLLKRNTTNFPIETLKGKIVNGDPVYNKEGEIIGYKVANSAELEETMEEMIASDNATGITDRREEPPLEAGELVLLDVDYLFPEGKINVEEDREEDPDLRYLIFEDRYRKELKDKER